jgi:hypothetical protein
MRMDDAGIERRPPAKENDGPVFGELLERFPAAAGSVMLAD